MISLLYVVIAVAFLLLVLGLHRRSRSAEPEELLRDDSRAPSVGNGRWLHLSERIFDPSDARWLADELGFPKLAQALTLERKRLAIAWLVALRASFDELLRAPDLSPDKASQTGFDGSWQMLWLAFRFRISISYALLVVRVFGPYHRLIPSFSWVPLSRARERSFRRPALANSRDSH